MQEVISSDDPLFEKQQIRSLENSLETDDQLFENHVRFIGYLRIDFEHAIFLKLKIGVSLCV